MGLYQWALDMTASVGPLICFSGLNYSFDEGKRVLYKLGAMSVNFHACWEPLVSFFGSKVNEMKYFFLFKTEFGPVVAFIWDQHLQKTETRFVCISSVRHRTTKLPNFTSIR